MTECNQESFAFEAHFSRRVEAGFTGGQITSDGGALLLREAERKSTCSASRAASPTSALQTASSIRCGRCPWKEIYVEAWRALRC